MQIKVKSGRLSIGDKIFNEGDILNVEQSSAIDALVRYGNLEVIQDTKVTSKVVEDTKVTSGPVNADLNGDGVFDAKDKSIASKIMRRVVKRK
jgi:hypothetical protein